MFESKHTRKSIALKFLDMFKDRLMPPGVPMNEIILGQVCRNAFLAADVFLKIDALDEKGLLSYGQPQMQMPNQVQRPMPVAVAPNGAPVAQFPPKAG